MTKIIYKFYIGIDVSKTKLDLALSKNNSVLQFSNDQNGIKELIKIIPSKKNTLIILEASGGYEKHIVNYLQKKKFIVAVVNAKRVRDFAKASGALAKTDSIDAKIIMNFGQAFNPKPQALVTIDEEQRLQNVNRRAQLIRMITLEKQHAEQATDIHTKNINRHIRFLEKELASIEESLKKQFQQDPILQDKLTRLDEIKGVGPITAMSVLVHMPELGQLSSKEISALAGVAPFNKDSGQMKGKRTTSGGRAQVRAALYMAVLSAKKSNAPIKRFYEQLISRGKIKKVAIVACMRKLIIIMNIMIRDNTVWEPGR
jgi:transposase